MAVSRSGAASLNLLRSDNLPEQVMAQFNDFLTKSVFKDPIKKVLELDGVETDHYLMISSLSSERGSRAYINLSGEFQSRMAEAEGEALTKVKADFACKLAAELIDSWSFDEPCNDENKLLFCEQDEGRSLSIYALAIDKENWRKKK